MYNGPKDDAKEYFTSIGYPCRENYNPADHYIWETSVMEGQEDFCKDKIKSISTVYGESSIFAKIKSSQISTKDKDQQVLDSIKESDLNRTGFFVSFAWLLWRSLISQVCV